MSDAVIRVEGLGKSYRLSHRHGESYVALRDVLSDKARALGRRLLGGAAAVPAGEEEEFWALRDVSFEVRRGEVLGIIGRNGAGKSTLLKILSRITEPTEGRVHMRGRVASLLEVGTGFHPELTGRENIYLNGAILGMSRAEIRRKFDEIVAFAEVEKFLDTPVKRYSSGMYVRLAFGVAAHLEPELLIVDEVLAVGDTEFQKRCLGKIRSIATQEGRTILFVSHNMSAIQMLCSKVVWLDAGRILGAGDPNEQIGKYLANAASATPQRTGSGRRLSPQISLEKFDFLPNPVEYARDVAFTLGLISSVSTVVRELVILFYSRLGIRVAIMDMREADRTREIGPDNPLHISGKICGVPFVEGEYAYGLYLNCGDVQADFYNLGTLTVVRSGATESLVPYPPNDRGIVDLSYEFGVLD